MARSSLVLILSAVAFVALGGGAADAGPSPGAPDAATIVSCTPSTEDDWPEVGDGCKISWDEELSDGTTSSTFARVRCDRSIQVCGEEVWCRCPSHVRPPPRKR